MTLDWVAIGADLANAGGWAAFVALVLAVGMGAVRKWWVPGWIHAEERKRSDDKDATIAAFSRSIDALTDEIRWRDRVRDAPR